MKLWIDDERKKPDFFTHWAKTPEGAINMLSHGKATGEEFELASFDHDLGWNDDGDIDSKPVLKWIIENDYWPHEIRFHTANFIAHKWLRLLARDEAPSTTFVNMADPWNDDEAYDLFGLGRKS